MPLHSREAKLQSFVSSPRLKTAQRRNPKLNRKEMLGFGSRHCCFHHRAGGYGSRSLQLLLISPTANRTLLSRCGGTPQPQRQQDKRFLHNNLSDQQEEEIARHRHHGILMHPDSISNLILPPGNVVRRTTRRGKVQNQYIELEYGYFWMIKDLKRSDEKPILSNDTLIPSRLAKPFPLLPGCKSLTGEKVDLGIDYLTRRNRSGDAAAQCTLVAISFRDFGFRQLPTVRMYNCTSIIIVCFCLIFIAFCSNTIYSVQLFCHGVGENVFT
jgi:hypothetical protein